MMNRLFRVQLYVLLRNKIWLAGFLFSNRISLYKRILYIFFSVLRCCSHSSSFSTVVETQKVGIMF